MNIRRLPTGTQSANPVSKDALSVVSDALGVITPAMGHAMTVTAEIAGIRLRPAPLKVLDL